MNTTNQHAPAATGAQSPQDLWTSLDWNTASKRVRNLRQRIFRATQEQDWQKVRDLQRLMLRSYSNLVLSVRQITQVNDGRKTPGVDGETALTNDVSQVESAGAELEFPLILKPNVGGIGALMRRFQLPAELADAGASGALHDLFGIDGTALVQEYHPPPGGAIVRVEVHLGQVLYASESTTTRIKALTCAQQTSVRRQLSRARKNRSTFARRTACRPKLPDKSRRGSRPRGLSMQYYASAPPAGLDLGGVGYLESEHDGRLYFYDVNALSNLVTDAPYLVGFDRFIRLGDLLQRRWLAAADGAARAA